MGLTEFFRYLFPQKPPRELPLHRFDDFTLEEIEIIEEALTVKVHQHAEWATNNFFLERYAEHWRKLVLLWEEISFVSARARMRDFEDRFHG